MAVATARAVSLNGAVGHLIDVQTDVSPGQPGLTLVGRPDTSLNEARDRCRMAISNSGLPWPATKRITVLLSPADLLKRGTHFDLAIATSVLAADGTVPASELAQTLFVGELSLDGSLRSITGALPMVLAAAERGITRVFVPEPQAREAAMVPGMEVYGVRSLGQVVAQLRHEEVPAAPAVAPLSGARLLTWRGDQRLDETDMADLIGMADTRYAVEVAAAGGHHLMLSGPKGAGKTSIAERIPGILPDLTAAESLELTAIHSLAGVLDPAAGLLVRPPYAAPHHDASKAALIGGGSGGVRPGAVSQSHAGVLFLDEFPLFRSDVIEALRQPLESGEVTIARREELVTLPARTMVVLACNPCPCGEYSTAPGSDCRCRPQQRQDYQTKVTGPVADRVDVIRHLTPLSRGHLDDRFEVRESSATIAVRVAAARERQAARFAAESWRLNAHAPGPALRERWPLPDAAQEVVDEQVYGGRLTRRGATRVHRLAWTIADLREAPGPGPDEVEIALRLRMGEPLVLSALGRVS